METTTDDRTMGMLCHLSTLAGWVFPFGNIIAPLIIWAIKKDSSGFVDDQGKEAMNFQISVTIYAIIAGLLFLVVIGIVLLPLVLLFSLIMTVVAAIQAYGGTPFRYPVCIRFIK